MLFFRKSKTNFVEPFSIVDVGSFSHFCWEAYTKILVFNWLFDWLIDWLIINFSIAFRIHFHSNLCWIWFKCQRLRNSLVFNECVTQKHHLLRFIVLSKYPNISSSLRLKVATRRWKLGNAYVPKLISSKTFEIAEWNSEFFLLVKVLETEGLDEWFGMKFLKFSYYWANMKILPLCLKFITISNKLNWNYTICADYIMNDKNRMWNSQNSESRRRSIVKYIDC